MKMQEVNKQFIQLYGGREKYKAALKDDYYRVQLDWTVFIDNLNKDGIISDGQRFRAVIPK